jgi:predicted enzyme related to lactoylglutathione lyase
MMPRIVHFEIPAEDPERAVKFYREAFGWEIKKWEGPMEYWLVMTGDPSEPGIDGGIMKRGDVKTVTNTIDVPALDDFIGKVEEAGGAVLAPKTAVPGVGWFAYCADTEGNIFGLMESDTSAK